MHPATPDGHTARRAFRAVATAMLLALPLAGTACGAPAQQPPAPAPPAATPSSTSLDDSHDAPPVAATNPPELAQRPCTGLDQRDAAALGIVNVTEGEDKGEKHCTLLAPAGLVSLTVYPNEDLHSAAGVPNNAQLSVNGHTYTRIDIGGHDALQTRFKESCLAFVSTTPGQSFLIITNPWPKRPTSDPCDTNTRFAAAILAHLGPP